jgi:hypothetical protein
MGPAESLAGCGKNRFLHFKSYPWDGASNDALTPTQG